MTSKRWIRLAALSVCLAATGCAGSDRREVAEAPRAYSIEEMEDESHAALERDLSLYAD
jgi:hypothetical protein